MNAIRALRQRIQAIDPGQQCADVWAGLDTQQDKVRTALRWQIALAAVLEGQAWEDDGFDAIAGGQCGATLQADLQRARRLRQLDQTLLHMHRWKRRPTAYGQATPHQSTACVPHSTS